jgi:hypothetical protein
MRRVLLAGAIVFASLALLAADDPRPACSSQNQGQMWPEAANRDSKLRARLIRCGELYICVRGLWHYRWETPTVRVDQLDREGKAKISKPRACDVDAAGGSAAHDTSSSAGPPSESTSAQANSR